MNSLRQFFNDYFPFLLLALIVVIGAKYRTLNRKSEEVKYNIPERMDNVIIDKSVINGNLIYLDTASMQIFIMVNDTMNGQDVIKRKYVDLVAKKIYE